MCAHQRGTCIYVHDQPPSSDFPSLPASQVSHLRMGIQIRCAVPHVDAPLDVRSKPPRVLFALFVRAIMDHDSSVGSFWVSSQLPQPGGLEDFSQLIP